MGDSIAQTWSHFRRDVVVRYVRYSNLNSQASIPKTSTYPIKPDTWQLFYVSCRFACSYFQEQKRSQSKAVRLAIDARAERL